MDSRRPGAPGCACVLLWFLQIVKHGGTLSFNIPILFEQVLKKDGEQEVWRVVYQKDNQPSTDTLEIPDLTPFTQYR